MAVIEPMEFTSTLVEAVAPKFTVVPGLNPVPSMSTWVPPPAGPPAGFAVDRRPVTVGAVR